MVMQNFFLLTTITAIIFFNKFCR